MFLTIRIPRSSRYFPQYPTIAYNDDKQRNTVKCQETKYIVGHFVVRRRKEVEAHALKKLRIIWMTFHMENNTLKKIITFIQCILLHLSNEII